MKRRAIDDEARDVLSRCKVHQRSPEGAFVYLPEALERDLYVRVNKVLTALGGKWSRGAKAHVFERGQAETFDALDAAAATGSYECPRLNDFFPTPPVLAAFMAEAADIRQGMLVLEPSAGEGAIIGALFKQYPFMGPQHLHACEMSPERAAVVRSRYGVDVVAADFIAWSTPPRDQQYDRVVMNPPFSGRQDGRHILRAYDMLRHDGRLVSVASAGINFREDAGARAVRELVSVERGAITPLANDTFKEAGASVRTVLVIIDKGGRQ